MLRKGSLRPCSAASMVPTALALAALRLPLARFCAKAVQRIALSARLRLARWRILWYAGKRGELFAGQGTTGKPVRVRTRFLEEMRHWPGTANAWKTPLRFETWLTPFPRSATLASLRCRALKLQVLGKHEER